MEVLPEDGLKIELSESCLDILATALKDKTSIVHNTFVDQSALVGVVLTHQIGHRIRNALFITL